MSFLTSLAFTCSGRERKVSAASKRSCAPLHSPIAKQHVEGYTEKQRLIFAAPSLVINFTCVPTYFTLLTFLLDTFQSTFSIVQQQQFITTSQKQQDGAITSHRNSQGKSLERGSPVQALVPRHRRHQDQLRRARRAVGHPLS